MSMVITAFPPDRAGRVLSVVLASTAEELRTVQRLRYRIYVEEMGVVPRDHAYVRGDRLVDAYDAWSSHLLLLADGVPIGTVRITEALDGRLELEESVDLMQHLPVGAAPAELTRLMVCRTWRRTQAAPLLLYGAFRLIASSRSTHLIAASKLGSLSTYYRRAGLKILDAEPFEYPLTGCTYRLGMIQVGTPGSVRRVAIRAAYGSLKRLANHASPVAHLLFRRRTSARRDPAPSRSPLAQTA